MIDLHTHSTASDGNYSPSELVKMAASKGIEVLALTDHDSTSGLLEAQEEAKRQGIVFVPGIEVTITWPIGEFHLLGLGLTHTSRELAKVIERIHRERVFRNKKMIEKLSDFGISLSYEEMVEKFGSENIGRPHFAQIMVEKGYVQSRQTAFDRFFAVGRPCYVERDGADLYDAVEAIKSSGGVPVQAHPLSIYVSWGKIEETMEGIRDSGVMGLEAWHPAIRVSEAERLVELGKKLGMVVTGGSDFHGEKVRADRRLGFSAGKLKVPENLWYEELKPFLEKVHGGDTLEYRTSV
ncbi:MAG: PHP domain-containing protein [Treponema sp.]|nr:PHP domain-containing protein [Treponema sp.]